MTTLATDRGAADEGLQSADIVQADHYRRMLLNHCHQLDTQLSRYRRTLANYERRDRYTQVRRMRGVIRAGEQERATLQRLLAALDARFGAVRCSRVGSTASVASRPAPS